MADDTPAREGPFEPRPASGTLVELDVTWARAIRVWWAATWRCLLAVPLGAGVGCVIGGVIGGIGGAMGVGMSRIQPLIQVVTLPVGLALGILVGIWAIRSVLRKRFQEFRIALLPRG